MRTWLYERLATDPDLIPDFGATEAEVRDRVIPRRSEETINLPRPFIIFGLGNDTNEDLSEDPDFDIHRQFLTIWIHDDGPSYQRIDDTLPKIKARLRGVADPADGVTMFNWLENSQEFNNNTYKTVFRYLRFQAIIARQGVTA